MTTTDALSIATDDCLGPQLRPLPTKVAELLQRLDAPPRLVAHLRAVHDVAVQLVDWVEAQYPAREFNREAVLFGAATHDIGKTLYVDELSGPGSEHEEAGRELLLAHGVDAELARFAGTHSSWGTPGVGIEDLLVSLADKIWKNKRVSGLEDLVVAELAHASGRAAWEEFMNLDETLTRIGDGAEERLAYQMSYPVRY
ncbi:HD domain-containing protein [Amycolatopsis taiwanensis]|uniref:HD domain-containing protein n=1 Tax=Amycolatopsis taiwanensis TaxID=342230 RepID=UPI00255221E3|nr:HD domain-containing protein [Amycolatopsis taiwanensis]